MWVQARHLSKTDGNIFATNDISIPPFSGKIIQDSIAITIPICQQTALIQEHTAADSIPVVPYLINVKQGYNSLPVEIVNETDAVIHILKGGNCKFTPSFISC